MEEKRLDREAFLESSGVLTAEYRGEPFQDCRFEGIYCFGATESRNFAVIGCPCGTLKVGSVLGLSSKFPSRTGPVSFPRNFRLSREARESIADQHAFRNEKFPMEIALTALVECRNRWNSVPSTAPAAPAPHAETPSSSSSSSSKHDGVSSSTRRNGSKCRRKGRNSGSRSSNDCYGSSRSNDCCGSGRSNNDHNSSSGSSRSSSGNNSGDSSNDYNSSSDNSSSSSSGSSSSSSSSECGGLELLRSFEVITSRRALRCLLRFLFPFYSPYLGSFCIDADLVGNSLLLSCSSSSSSSSSAKGVAGGFGRDFERRCVKRAAARLAAKGAEDLTSAFVLHSTSLFGALRLVVSAEIDALLPLPGAAAAARRCCCCCCSGSSGCCSSSSSRCCCCCSFEFRRIGSNDCFVHSCPTLSLLEQQLLQGSPPFVELKTHSSFSDFAAADAADQMLLGGVRRLLKEESPDSQIARWKALAALLLQLRKLAQDAKDLPSDEVACIRVQYFARKEYLKIQKRNKEEVRLSEEAASWLKTPGPARCR